jgi:hypothetical protein
MKELLADRDTRLLLGSQWVTQIADGLVQASFANVLILEPEGTISRILGVSALTLLPYSLIAPFMGVFVDRWRRRNVLIGTSTARVLLLLVLSVVAHLTSGDVPLYIGLLGLLGLGRLYLTTKGAVLPFVLHEKHLLQGNSLSGGGGMIAALVGGVLGIGAIAAVDTANTFLVGAGLYASAGSIASRISHTMGHPRKQRGSLRAELLRIWQELIDGMRAIWSRAGARLPLLGVFIVRVAAMVAAVTAIIIIKDHFPDSGDRFGRLSSSALALGTAGIGAFVGALVAPRLGRRFSEPALMLIGFVMAGAGILALGGVAEIWAVLLLTFFGGLGGFIAKVAVDSQVQQALPDDYRGRGFAVYDILYNLATVAAAVLLLFSESGSLRAFCAGLGVTILLFALALGHAMKQAGLFVGTERPTTVE